MPRTITQEREADLRSIAMMLRGARADNVLDLLTELDAERAESQRLQSRIVALETALVDLIDASQDARCADLRIVIKRASAAIEGKR